MSANPSRSPNVRICGIHPAGSHPPLAGGALRRPPWVREQPRHRPPPPPRRPPPPPPPIGFASSIVTVIGPTPPGTGVIQDATSFTDSKSTSPTLRQPLLPVASGARLLPTATTTAPGRT